MLRQPNQPNMLGNGSPNTRAMLDDVGWEIKLRPTSSDRCPSGPTLSGRQWGRLDGVLTLSPPRVINFKFFLQQPHQKKNITQYEERGFIAYSDKNDYTTKFLTTSLIHLSSKGWENLLCEFGSERVEHIIALGQHEVLFQCWPGRRACSGRHSRSNGMAANPVQKWKKCFCFSVD